MKVRNAPADALLVTSLALSSLSACSEHANDPLVLTQLPDAEDAIMPTYPAEQVAGALAHCDDPPGATITLTSVPQEVSLLDGSWLVCPVPFDAGFALQSLPPRNIGVRFTMTQGEYGLSRNADGSVTLADNIGYPAEQGYGVYSFPGLAEDNIAGGIESPLIGGKPVIEAEPRRFTIDSFAGAFVYLGK